MPVKSIVVNRGRMAQLWPTIKPALDDYRTKTPHPLPSDEKLFADWTSDGGDEVFVFGDGKRFAGFMTFKVQRLNEEVWGTIAIIYVTPEFQNGEALPEAAKQLENVLRQRGCNVMNYMTARKGFRRLAPRLGFRPRITEYMKEL